MHEEDRANGAGCGSCFVGDGENRGEKVEWL